MPFRAPVDEILFAMTALSALGGPDGATLYADLADGSAADVLREAATFAENVLEPLNGPGDREGARFAAGTVTTPSGWRDAYAAFAAGGWAGLAGPLAFGGADLPQILQAGCFDIWNAANTAFMLGPLLGIGAIAAIEAHGSEALKATYLPRMVSGEWTGTMCLTEPQAGSDLALIRTRAERRPDGTYGIKGQKIYITYGEHDWTDNIVHLVLARLPDAPEGTRGISMFCVPKMRPDETGAFTIRNGVHCAGIERKMGIHGAPTCTMVFGADDEAVGFLVGTENKGLAGMFTMMNNARLTVGLQGVGLAEAATQKAFAYAAERVQGTAGRGGAVAIARHPDVQRMLFTMRSLTEAARAICLMTAGAIDESHRAASAEARERAAARAGLLTPLAKAFSSDIGVEVASLGVQVHGGAGYVEDTGAAQLLRDSRIAPIYEGTNGIQAIDLVARKLGPNGAVMEAEIAAMRADLDAARAVLSNGTVQGLVQAVDELARATQALGRLLATAPQEALAGAAPYLRLFGLARGGTALARLASADQPDRARRVALVRVFAETIAVGAPALAATVVDGGGAIGAAAEAFG